MKKKIEMTVKKTRAEKELDVAAEEFSKDVAPYHKRHHEQRSIDLDLLILAMDAETQAAGCSCELEQIELWKKTCIKLGKILGFELDINKIKKTVLDEYERVMQEPPTANEALVDFWKNTASTIRSGDKAFCRSHKVAGPTITSQIKKILADEKKISTWAPEKVDQLDDNQWCKCSRIKKMCGVKDARDIYEHKNLKLSEHRIVDPNSTGRGIHEVKGCFLKRIYGTQKE